MIRENFSLIRGHFVKSKTSKGTTRDKSINVNLSQAPRKQNLLRKSSSSTPRVGFPIFLRTTPGLELAGDRWRWWTACREHLSAGDASGGYFLSLKRRNFSSGWGHRGGTRDISRRSRQLFEATAVCLCYCCSLLPCDRNDEEENDCRGWNRKKTERIWLQF